MGSGRRGGGGAGGGGGGRNQRLLKHHIDICRKKFSTTDDIVDHLRQHYSNYRRMELKTLTRLVHQTLTQKSPSQSRQVKKFKRHALESEAEDEENSITRPVTKKQKRDESEEEEKLIQIENEYSRRRIWSQNLDPASSSERESGSESLTSLEPPKFDLMQSMLRESYAATEKNIELEVATDRKASISNKIDMIDRNRKAEKQNVEHLEGNLGKLRGGDGVEVKGTEGGPRFRELGGLSEVLEELEMEVFLPLYHPNVPLRLGVNPVGGILLHGPPGCGKTKLAHAIANETGVPFYKISATEVVSGVSGDCLTEMCCFGV